MRRLLSLALLLLFGWPLVAPALALIGGPDANLPACCRRNGKHHCSMNLTATKTGNPTPNFSAPPQKCPAFPAMVTPFHPGHLALPPAPGLITTVQTHPTGKAQTQARARVALHRSRQKRGPPSRLL